MSSRRKIFGIVDDVFFCWEDVTVPDHEGVVGLDGHEEVGPLLALVGFVEVLVVVFDELDGFRADEVGCLIVVV